MRKEYDFSGGVRGCAASRSKIARSRRPKVGRSVPDDDTALSKAQVRELRRRLADLKDPVRYLIVSGIAPGFVLYYNVADDVYAMNDPSHATLFKRRKAAGAVKQLLGRGTRIIRCTTRRRNGLRVPVLPAGFGRRKSP